MVLFLVLALCRAFTSESSAGHSFLRADSVARKAPSHTTDDDSSLQSRLPAALQALLRRQAAWMAAHLPRWMYDGGSSTQLQKDEPHYDLLFVDLFVVFVVCAPFLYFTCCMSQSDAAAEYAADQSYASRMEWIRSRPEDQRIYAIITEMRDATNRLQIHLPEPSRQHMESDEFTTKCSSCWYQWAFEGRKLSWRVISSFILDGLTADQVRKVKRNRLWFAAFDESQRIGERAALIDKPDLDDVFRWVHAVANSPEDAPTATDASPS